MYVCMYAFMYVHAYVHICILCMYAFVGGLLYCAAYFRNEFD